MKNEQKEQKEYKTPDLVVHGSVETVTQAAHISPTTLDANYPTNTPFSELGWQS